MEAHHYLQALGLTEYEARAYVALLGLGKAAPAKIARHSKIPRPKVYETLERLEARGLATRTQVSPLEYAALSAREYVARAERDFEQRLSGLERALARLQPEPVPEAVYPLTGEGAVLGLAADLVEHARRTLHLAGDESVAARLEARAGRGIRVVRASVRGLPPLAADGQTALLVARDGEAALVAHIPAGDSSPHGVHTHNPVIVRLVEGYVALALQREAVR
ncbi:MAG TPA: helix-turn-helix domain-containing protein [Deinococcales bacterium]|nr:helix-turn-helix domain-containing protein [Deinococcales bacterium]